MFQILRPLTALLPMLTTTLQWRPWHAIFTRSHSKPLAVQHQHSVATWPPWARLLYDSLVCAVPFNNVAFTVKSSHVSGMMLLLLCLSVATLELSSVSLLRYLIARGALKGRTFFTCSGIVNSSRSFPSLHLSGLEFFDCGG